MSYPVGVPLTYSAVAATPGYDAAGHTFSWTFEDGTTQTGASVSKTWATVGDHLATVTAVSNGTGGSATASKIVTMKNPPSTFGASFAKTKAYFANNKVFTVFGEQYANYEVGILNADGSTGLVPVTGDGSFKKIVNYGACSSDISVDSAWVCSLGATSGSSVASKLHTFNTISNTTKQFDIAALGSNYFAGVGGISSCMIVARPDNKFAISIQNSTWWAPATFIYDPVTNTHSNLITGIYAYTSGLIINAGNDYVYCFARSAYSAAPLADTAKYRISTHTWSEFIPSGTALTALSDGSWIEPSVCKMADGKFIVVGGSDGGTSAAVNKVAIFDPATGTINLKANLGTARYWPMLALLPDGKILAAGGATGSTGNGLATAEIYNPATDTWTALGNNLIAARGCAGIAQLPSGNFVLTGGIGAAGTYLNSVEYFHPADNKFYPVD